MTPKELRDLAAERREKLGNKETRLSKALDDAADEIERLNRLLVGVHATELDTVADLPALDALVVYYMSRGWPSYSDRERADKEWTDEKSIAQSTAFKRHLARTSSGALLTGAAPAGPDGCDVAQTESARPRPDQPGSGVMRREDVALRKLEAQYAEDVADLEAMKARGDLTKDYGEHSLYHARKGLERVQAAILALPHTGQPVEGEKL